MTSGIEVSETGTALPGHAASLGVFVHLFYPELTGEICTYLRNLPTGFAIYVSTDTDAKADAIQRVVRECFPEVPCEVRVLPNKGWDIGPFVAGFEQEILRHPIGLKIHGKKSDNQLQRLFGWRWRTHLFSGLLGSRQRVDEVLSAFARDERLGFQSVKHWAPNLPWMNIGNNFPKMSALLTRIGRRLEPAQPIDFPSGSMFWFRSAALKPLLDLKLGFDDFDLPSDETRDGTLAHAIERSFFYFGEKGGFHWKTLAPPLDAYPEQSTRRRRLGLLWRARVQFYPAFALSTAYGFAAEKISGLFDRKHKPAPAIEVNSKAEQAPVQLPDPDSWRSVAKRGNVAGAKVDVIIPVYRGYTDTLACIYSVLSNRQASDYELIVIDDCGPDGRLAETLQSLGGGGYFTYLRNDENQGFVRTANRGIALHKERDVILLNSDTVVYGNWIDRLLRHAADDPKIATITPFSNNATICSYPQTNADNRENLEIPFEALDRLAAEANALSRNEVPTGVGFCFYMSRAAIETCGELDAETFGRGYGEENDFCMRARASGFRNVLAHDVFVYHTGEVSFSEIKKSLRDDAQKKLQRKHPKYHALVWDYIKRDPSRDARLRLDLRRIKEAAAGKLYVFISHVYGGGTEKYVRDLIAMAQAENAVVLIFRVGDKGRTGLADGISIECELAAKTMDLPNIGSLDAKDSTRLEQVLRWLAPTLIHVQSVAGLSREAIRSVFGAITRSQVPYVFTWHDHMPLCHRIQFVRPGGKYCGEPPVEVCRACIRSDWQAWNEFDPADRRAEFGAFLRGASRVISPSESAKLRALRLVERSSVVAHPERFDDARWAAAIPSAAMPLRVAILGEIVTHKGARVLAEMAADAELRALPIEFMIVGATSGWELSTLSNVTITGRYEGAAGAAAHLRAFSPHLVMIPSIWPETYCYALSLAFENGIPPVVFDHGAQAERVRSAGWGIVLPGGIEAEPGTINDTLLSLPIEAMWRERRRPAEKNTMQSLAAYYALG